MSTIQRFPNRQRERCCDACGKIEITTTRLPVNYEPNISKDDICIECLYKDRQSTGNEKDFEYLSSLGYTHVEYAGTNEHRKRTYSMVSPCCGTKHTMVLNNVRTMFKKYGKPPCPTCGGKARGANLLASNGVNKLSELSTRILDDYVVLCENNARAIVERNADLVKSVYGVTDGAMYAIDFKISPRVCFLKGIPIGIAASLVNVMLRPVNGYKRPTAIDLSKWNVSQLDIIDPVEQLCAGWLSDEWEQDWDIPAEVQPPVTKWLSNVADQSTATTKCNVCTKPLGMFTELVRTCGDCGSTHPTRLDGNSRTDVAKTPPVQFEIDQIESYGYSDVVLAGVNQTQWRMYQMVAPCCGRTSVQSYVTVDGNKRQHNEITCKPCDDEAKLVKVHAGFKETLGVEHNPEQFEAYRLLVGRETEKTYDAHKGVINPYNVKRASSGIADAHHLDHKMSVRDCYLHSIPVELAASLVNLRMIPASENTVKSSRSIIDLRKWVGIDQSSFTPVELVAMSSHADVIDLPVPENPAEHVQEFLEARAVVREARVMSPITIAATKERAVSRTGDYISQMEANGFTNISRTGADQYGRPIYTFTTRDGRVLTLVKSKIDTALKHGEDIRPEGMSKSDQQASRLRGVGDSDETRTKKVAAQAARKIANGGKVNTDEARAKVSATKTGNRRWYNPDFPSFKQSKECPGDGWTLTKPTK